MKKLFGTDGIRAVAGRFPLDYPSIYALGKELAILLRDEKLEPEALIGRDTRESGPWMEEALVRGFRDEGGRALSAGVIPTSAVSLLTRTGRFSTGVVLSASHNPYHDNGIKIFSSDGIKIRESWEARLEDGIRRRDETIGPRKTSIRIEENFLREYEAFLENRFPEALRPRRLRIVMDCANGAASFVAPKVFRELGFKVTVIHDTPDGRNINKDCGSLHPGALAEEVVRAGAAMGVAYDGDADRAILVDETGRVLDGDHTLYVQALYMNSSGRLRSGLVVATTMSNMGLEKGLGRHGIGLVRTRVGDKYVFEEMIRRDANLGGEQSGHTIFLDDGPTGDGLLTSLKMAEAVLAQGAPLSRLVAECESYPQVLVNVHVTHHGDFAEFPEIPAAVESIRNELGEDGRIDLRRSGTEPVVRIMIEGRDSKEIGRHAKNLADLIHKYMGT